jgi:integrase/recombinase XerD
MASVKRAAAAVAAILVREGVDYAQSKAVFKAARERAGLRAAPEHRGGVDRLPVEEELRFLDRAYAQDDRTGLMLQTLLETGVRASELVLLTARVAIPSTSGRYMAMRNLQSWAPSLPVPRNWRSGDDVASARSIYLKVRASRQTRM